MQFLLAFFSSKYLFPLWDILHKASLLLMGYSYVHHNETNLMRHLKYFYGNKRIIFFDVGLNIGSYTKEIYEIFQGNITAYGFEPVGATFDIAKKNLEGKNNIYIYNYGMAEREKEIEIHYNQAGEGTASIVSTGKKHKELIQLKTIDQFANNNSIEHIDFMKIDVEGYEYFVLEGSKILLDNKAIDIIQFEFFRTNIQSKIFFHDFWHLLSDNFKIYRILNNSMVEIKQYHPADCEIFLGMNYLAVQKGLSFKY